MLIEKDVARLSVGNYVESIARQSGSYKLKHKGRISSLHLIEILIDKGVERVIVDTSKHLDSEKPIDTARNISKELKHNLLVEEPIASGNKSGDKNFAESITNAKAIFDESKQIQKKLFDDVICGRQIELEPIIEITRHTTETIFENPDALACIINIRIKDEYLLEHSTAVSILMSIFCRYMDVDIETTKELSIGAFLHDVGKIKVPDKILNKPGKLTSSEFEVMKTHVLHSVNIINKIPNISKLSLEVAALHHEKLDSSGYPLGLAGDKISKFGRMITICDIFDALTANRVYRDGMAQVRAFAILRNMAEQEMLDSDLVIRFIKCMGVYPVGSLVKLESNQLAVVETRNPDDPIRPKVKAFYSVSQNHFVEAKDIDLSNEDQENIEKGVRADDFDLDMNKILEFLILAG